MPRKSQSAMEYLMTYGWAILIIAVVLGALFQLGVFNAGAFAPRASPGACQVFRPNGPNTAQFINLEGVCNGELPQYVGVFNGNGAVVTMTTSADNALCNFTLTAWSYDSGMPSSGNRGGIVAIQAYGSSGGVVYGGPDLENNDGSYRFEYIYNNGAGSTGGDQYYSSSNFKGIWIFSAMTFNGVNGNTNSAGTPSEYINGVGGPYGSAVTCAPVQNGQFRVGIWDRYFNGSISNVQIYNTSLSSNEIQYLYSEGIGGAPLKLQNLVGWWPLNGNANDYSGNDGNGATSGGVTYTSQWTSGYTPP